MKKEDIGGQWHDNQSRRPDQPRSTFGAYSQNSSHLCCRMNYLIGIPRRIDKARGESWNPNLIITITLNPHLSNFLLTNCYQITNPLDISQKRFSNWEAALSYICIHALHCTLLSLGKRTWALQQPLGISKAANKTMLRCLHQGWVVEVWVGAFQWCFYLVFTLIHIIQGCRGQCSTG